LLACFSVATIAQVRPVYELPDSNEIQRSANERISLLAARQSCENGGTISAAFNMAALRAEFQKTAETMEVDSLGRPTKFVVRGKTFLPMYENDRLTGFRVDGEKINITATIDPASPEAAQVFYRGEDGSVKSLSRVNSQSLRQSGLSLTQENSLTPDIAKQQALSAIKETPSMKWGGWDDDKIIVPQTCYVCDADLNIDVGYCLGGGGLIGGAIIGGATAVCVASLGLGCGFSIAAAVLLLALDYNLTEICVQGARQRYVSCRSRCI
jgi:hypothetical protein